MLKKFYEILLDDKLIDWIKAFLYQQLHSLQPVNKSRSFCGVVEVEQILPQLKAQGEDVDSNSTIKFWLQGRLPGWILEVLEK